jgi:hypothetical protein
MLLPRTLEVIFVRYERRAEIAGRLGPNLPWCRMVTLPHPSNNQELSSERTRNRCRLWPLVGHLWGAHCGTMLSTQIGPHSRS